VFYCNYAGEPNPRLVQSCASGCVIQPGPTDICAPVGAVGGGIYGGIVGGGIYGNVPVTSDVPDGAVVVSVRPVGVYGGGAVAGGPGLPLYCPGF